MPDTPDPRAPIARAEAAVLAAPRRAKAWLDLAWAHWSASGPKAALGACESGLRAAPGDLDLLCAKAEMLRRLGRAGEARALFGQALAAAPELPDAAFGLALMALEAGDWDRAQRLAGDLRAGAPAHAGLRWLHARIALGRGDPSAALPELAAVLADPALDPAQRAEALLLQSDAFDKLDDPSSAFAAAVSGKALQRGLHAGAAQAREGAAQRFRRLDAWFRAADPAPWRTPPPAGRDPCAGHVFLVGFPRSGTTLLEQALAGHPQVVALEEAPTLAAAHAEFLASDAGLWRLANLTDAEADHWRGVYWSEVTARGVDPRGRLFLDKAPAGTEDVPLMARLFPHAKLLFALRDPRDVVLSCVRHNFQMNALTYAFTDLAAAAQAYDAGFTLADTYRDRLPLDLMEVRHEALVEDFTGGLAQICGFLGVAFDPGMTDVAATAHGRVIRTPSAPQVRAGLSRRGIGRWRAYAQELAPILPVLTPWAARFGYEP